MNPFFFNIFVSIREDNLNISQEIHNESFDFSSKKKEKRGLTSREIKTLKEKKYSKNLKTFSDECPICLMSFENNQPLKILDCQHCFHSKCLKRWLENQRTCPYCKLLIKIH